MGTTDLRQDTSPGEIAYERRVAKIPNRFGAESNGSRKGENRLELQIGCRSQAAVTKSVYLGPYLSAPAKGANAPTWIGNATLRNHGNRSP